MGRKISLKRARQLQEKTPQIDRTKRKQKERDEKRNSWKKNLEERGGFKRKRAKKWGDYCDYPECSKWEDEECAYTERDTERCYLLQEKKG